MTVACASAPKVKAVPVARPVPSRSIAELEAALGSASADERRAAAWELAGAGELSDQGRASLARMRDSDPDAQARLGAVWALGHITPERGAKGPTRDVGYDTPPRITHQTRPVYPVDAFEKGIAGIVLIEFLIDEQGNVAHAEVRESIPALDAAALQTVREWKFQPAMKGDHAVPSMAIAPVTFKIG